MKNHTKFSALATTILLSVAVTSPAQAVEPKPEPTVITQPLEIVSQSKVVASKDAKVSFEKESVKPTPAPKKPTSEVKVLSAEIEPVPAPAPIPEPTPVAHPAPVEPVAPVIVAPPAPEPVPALVPEPVVTPPAPQPVAPAATTQSAPSSGVAAGLVASAYGQIGITQDCTAMVENALASVGKPVGDLGPSQFFGVGTTVGSPAPGDIVITSGHVAIYVGNGQVISGGMNGVNATMLHPLSDLAGASFVRVGRQPSKSTV